ncbi:MAG: RcpC/CpaB family pilus assembly protein [Acidimicrobiales bacterium]
MASREPRVEASQGARPLPRRRALPGGRAVVGGLLVALAAVGTFAAYTNATRSHSLSYVVTRQALPVGHRITATDLGLAPMDLPSSIASHLAFRTPTRLIGAVVVGPMAAGELVQASDVVAGPPAPKEREMSFALPASAAVGGTLVPGDRVDVLATFGTGAEARTVAVVRAVPVVSRVDGSGGIAAGSNSSEVITLALSTSAQTLALAHALAAGEVILVRSTGAGPASDSGSYPPAPGKAAASQSRSGAGGR